MAGPISIEDIVNASLKGIVKAQKDYELWSEEWLWKAPEYFSTVYVAQEIAKIAGSKFITLENGAKSAIKDAGAIKRGKLHGDIRKNGRFDILLWWANRKPRAPIEVKCQVINAKKIMSDIKRIKGVLHINKHDASFNFGAVVFYSSYCDDKIFKAKTRLEQSLKNILADVKKVVGDSCYVSMDQTKIYTVDDSAWVGAAIVLKPKNI